MDLSVTYTKTGRGARALIKKLPPDAGQILSVMSSNIRADDIFAKLKKVNKKDFEVAITWLLEGGFIKVVTQQVFSDSIWAPVTQSAISVAEISIDEFNQSAEARERAELQKKAEAQAKQEAEANAIKQAELLATAIADAKSKLETQAKAEADARERASVRAKATIEAEEKARTLAVAKAEAEARALAEEQAKIKAAAEEQARVEAIAKATIEAKEKAAAEAKAQAEAAAEAEKLAQIKAAQEAQEHAKVLAKAEALEQARAKAELKEQAKIEALAKAEAKAEKSAQIKAEDAEKKLAKATAKKEARILIAQQKAEKKAKQQQEKTDAKLNKQTLNANKTNPFQSLIEKIKLRNILGICILWIFTIFSIFKKAILLTLIALVLSIIAAQFANLSFLVAPIESIAESNIKEPVNIKAVHASLFPMPQLILNNVSVGQSSDIKCATVRIFPVVSSLIDSIQNQDAASQKTYEIESIEIASLTLNQQNLARPMAWLEATKQSKQLKISQIVLKNTVVQLNHITLPVFNADIQLDNAGQLNSSLLIAQDQNLKVSLHHSGNQMLFDLSGTNWRAPIAANPLFSQLNAKGNLENNVLTFSTIRAELYSGQLKANLQINTAADWATSGAFELIGLNLLQIAQDIKANPAAEGTLQGKSKFAFKIDTTTNRIQAASMNGDFAINNGAINKLDLVAAMRANVNRHIIGGSTPFSTLTGNFSLNNQSYQLRNLTLQDKQLQASGRLDILADQSVSGEIDSKILLKSSPIKAHLVVAGSTDNFSLKK